MFPLSVPYLSSASRLHLLRLHSFYPTPLLSSISLNLVTMLSIHHSSSQMLFPSLPAGPHLAAVGSKCRGDRAWAKISSSCRSLSMYQLIGINVHPRTLLRSLWFVFLSVRGSVVSFFLWLKPSPFFSNTVPKKVNTVQWSFSPQCDYSSWIVTFCASFLLYFIQCKSPHAQQRCSQHARPIAHISHINRQKKCGNHVDIIRLPTVLPAFEAWRIFHWCFLTAAL